ncbi:uncharacterized protein LOC122512830 [Leptopilina heterotoma]|uniref:uncharacterized protein LOC122512830 n=1 Tax=Leptopilina heterotoma TaxID=63436 RepID=UPI001CA930C8|nr:uncharacterized protein LOC122512830 [Leptopilina heterotoma]
MDLKIFILASLSMTAIEGAILTSGIPVLAKIENFDPASQYIIAYDTQDVVTGNRKSEFEIRNANIQNRYVVENVNNINGFTILNQEAVPVIEKTVPIATVITKTLPVARLVSVAPVGRQTVPVFTKTIASSPVILETLPSGLFLEKKSDISTNNQDDKIASLVAPLSLAAAGYKY